MATTWDSCFMKEKASFGRAESHARSRGLTREPSDLISVLFKNHSWHQVDAPCFPGCAANAGNAARLRVCSRCPVASRSLTTRKTPNKLKGEGDPAGLPNGGCALPSVSRLHYALQHLGVWGGPQSPSPSPLPCYKKSQPSLCAYAKGNQNNTRG